MNDIRQIKLIAKSLNKMRERNLFEVAKTNIAIEKKTNLIKKMNIYLAEYHNEENLPMSKSLPRLAINFHLFTQQIESVVSQTQKEIENLKRSLEIVLKRIQKDDQKLKLMDMFETRIKESNLSKAEKLEQRMTDDLSATKHLREDSSS